MIRTIECRSFKSITIQPNTEKSIPIYSKNINIRDSDNIEFFLHFPLEELGVDGRGASYDGKKVVVTLFNKGQDSVYLKRGDYIGYILLE